MAPLQKPRGAALYQYFKSIFNNVNRHAGTVPALTQAHVHGSLMIQEMQVALLGGALRLRNLIISLGNGGA